MGEPVNHVGAGVAWRVSGASVQGGGHLRSGTQCQDSHLYRVRGGALVAAVADGAGSATEARAGAQLAVETSIRAAIDLLGEQHPDAAVHGSGLHHIAECAVRASVARLRQEARLKEVDINQMATTLLLVVHADGEMAVAQIGDGAVVWSESPGHYMTSIAPQGGEYDNETVFLTSASALDTMEIKVSRPDGSPLRLAMFTDGLQKLALNSKDDSPHGPFFDPIFAWLDGQDDPCAASAHMAAFLSSEKVGCRTDDDLTLVLATLSEC